MPTETLCSGTESTLSLLPIMNSPPGTNTISTPAAVVISRGRESPWGDEDRRLLATPGGGDKRQQPRKGTPRKRGG